jgi:chorismate mutase
MGVKLELEPIELCGECMKRPIIIAGPCSAETEEQVMTTARDLSARGVRIYRAGIWKPRTRPNAFEGIGSVGLEWLSRVKRETGMQTTTEIATVKHVEECLKAGVDILWIGARTTANPFAVQDIADALRGVDITVMIKNPVNPDIELWIGALERLNNSGIKKMIAIHRGFSVYDKSLFRNDPQWQVPIELRRRIPDLRIITDPSHICGNRHMLYDVSQKAMDLNFDGLIIETHCNPDAAWSDAKQQITPAELLTLLSRLVFRDEGDLTAMISLAELREQIDKLDDKLIQIFEKRMKVVEEIGKHKKENNITILQSQRWDDIVRNRINLGSRKGLSEEFIYKVFQAIHQESINKQTVVMNQNQQESK